jgi:hypothetical protein
MRLSAFETAARLKPQMNMNCIFRRMSHTNPE